MFIEPELLGTGTRVVTTARSGAVLGLAANGIVMAMAVVYRPKWVMSFDDRLYLRKRDS